MLPRSTAKKGEVYSQIPSIIPTNDHCAQLESPSFRKAHEPSPAFARRRRPQPGIGRCDHPRDRAGRWLDFLRALHGTGPLCVRARLLRSRSTQVRGGRRFHHRARDDTLLRTRPGHSSGPGHGRIGTVRAGGGCRLGSPGRGLAARTGAARCPARALRHPRPVCRPARAPAGNACRCRAAPACPRQLAGSPAGRVLGRSGGQRTARCDAGPHRCLARGWHLRARRVARRTGWFHVERTAGKRCPARCGRGNRPPVPAAAGLRSAWPRERGRANGAIACSAAPCCSSTTAFRAASSTISSAGAAP